jgi:hypothetical protein
MLHRDLALAGLPGRSHWAMIWLAIACKSSGFVDRLMERCAEGLAGRNLLVAAKIPRSQNHSAS